MDSRTGRLCGFILRSQLIVVLKQKLYLEKSRFWNKEITIETFRNEYPRYKSIDVSFLVVKIETNKEISQLRFQKINIDARDLQFTVSCEPFMNPSPYTVSEQTSAPRLFRLFRALGLRHLVVVDQDHRVRGIITRQDLVHKH